MRAINRWNEFASENSEFPSLELLSMECNLRTLQSDSRPFSFNAPSKAEILHNP